MNKRQVGFSIVELIIIVVILGIAGFIVWRMLGSPASTGTDSKGNQVAFVEWSYNGESWQYGGTVPACEDPLSINAPMDMTKATSKLWPGQVRGGDFKPHGGLAVDTSTDNKVTVMGVRDAFLYRGSRYIQDNTVQYMFDFMDSCGVMYRLDHLAKLTDQFMAYADKLPTPQVDDSRTYRFDEHPLITKGTVIATEVGIPGNAFFDLGVYDLRKQNAISKTDLYKTDQLRISDKEQSFFATCWFDLLPSADKTLANALPSRNGQHENPSAVSDYCK